jgi:hypothetical protein
MAELVTCHWCHQPAEPDDICETCGGCAVCCWEDAHCHICGQSMVMCMESYCGGNETLDAERN